MVSGMIEGIRAQGGAGESLRIDALYFNVTYTETSPDTTAPNVTIIVPPRININNTNVSGLFVINASVNDSASNVNEVNLSLLQPGSIASGPIPMNLSAGGLKSGYWNKTFDSTTLPDGRYNLSVNATDSSATPNTAISENVSIIIDNTKPNGTSNFQINTTEPVVTNTAPIVFNSSVALNSSVTLTEGGKTQFTVAFNITDADGTADIVNATVGVNITFNGIRRSNNTGNCQNLGDSSSTTNAYSCIVVFNYFDNSTTLWDINITAADVAGLVSHNDSQSPGSGAAHNLTVESLSAFSLSTGSVATTANINIQDNELSFVINNTGNFDFTILNVTPFNLNASITDIFALNGNFSINATPSTSLGFGDNIQNATPRNFTESSNQISATLPHKITSGEADNLGNRTLYIYIDIPLNKGLSTGVTYNSSLAWELFAS